MKPQNEVKQVDDKPSTSSIHAAAQCWQDEETSSIEMDSRLARAFAKRLDKEITAERVRLLTLILKEQNSMVSDYKHTIKHTGGLLTKSMVYAYSKAINEVFKLINKGAQNEKPVQEEK